MPAFRRSPVSWRPVPLVPILTASILAAASPVLHAGTETWTNFTGTNNWSAGTNWLDGTAPIGADATLDLVFGATGAETYTATNDIPGLLLNTLTLNSTSNGLVTLDGTSLDFGFDDTAPAINVLGTGAFTLAVPMILTSATTLTGSATTGRVTLNGLVSGSSDLVFNAGTWRLGNTENTYLGTTTINSGAVVELISSGASPQGINLTPGAATILGANTAAGAVRLDGGTLKVTTQGTGGITLGGRSFGFGLNGGTVEMRNLNVPGTQGGGVTGGQLVLSLTNGATAPAVLQFSGGQNGLSTNTTNNGDWSLGNNVLRIGGLTNTGTGALQTVRYELSNGAMVRGGTGGTGTVTQANPIVVAGVPVSAGGDPTSGPAGTVSSSTTLTTGRFGVDTVSIINYTGGLRFENAMQVHNPGKVRAIDGNITIAGTASGAPGYVAFLGRSTGTQMNSNILLPAGAAGDVGQHVMWLGQDGNDLFTVEGGGIAVFDARNRADQANHHGVYLDARAVLNPGATLRVAQSLSNFSALVGITNFSTTAVVGDTTLNGDLVAQGTTASESVFDIYLPAPDASGTAANGVPPPLTLTAQATGTTARPFGGLVATSAHEIIIDGTGFGGLRVNALSRPDRLFSATLAAGGAATPDPTPNATKLSAYLTTTRLAGITGTGGYLTPAVAGGTFTFPAGGEWAPGVPVGLRVANSNAGGVDVAMTPTSWGHNLAVEAGATLALGAANPFTFSTGTLHGAGTLASTGSIAVNAGANVSPGFAGIGTLNVEGNLALSGAYLLDVATTTSDSLNITGNLTLGGNLTIAGIFGNTDFTIASYTGTLTNTFGAVVGLNPDFVVNYGAGTNSTIRLVFAPPPLLTWEGTPGANWNLTDGNWKTGATFGQGNKVVFDDTALGSRDVVINGGNVQPAVVTVNTAANYSITGSAGNAIIGGMEFIKSGTGVLSLAGPHAYLGGTTINGGTLRLGSNNALPDSGAVTIATGATLDTNGNSDTIEALFVNGAVSGSGSLTTPSAVFAANSSGALGGLNVGALTVGNGVTLTVGTLNLNGDVTRVGTGAGATIAGGLNLGGATRTITVPAGTAPELTISAAISNGGLTKAGTGTLVLSGTNTHAGPTTVNAGTLRAGANGALSATSDVTVAAGATLDGAGFAVSAGGISGAGTIALGAGSLTTTSANTFTFSGLIEGVTGLLIKAGTGILNLTGPNTFAGGLNINGGRVNVTNATGAGSGIITINAGGELQPGATLVNNITLNGGTLSTQTGASVGTGELLVASPSAIDIFNKDTNANTDIIFTGTLRGAANLAINPGPNQANADQGSALRLRGTGISDYNGTVTVNQRVKFEIQMNTEAAPNPLGTGKMVLNAGTSTGELGGTYPQVQPRLVAGPVVPATEVIYPLGNNVEMNGAGYVNFNLLGAGGTVAQFGNLRIGDTQVLGASKNDGSTRNTVAFSTVTLTGGNAEFRAFDPGFGQVGNANRGGSNIRLGNVSGLTADAGLIFRATAPFQNEIAGNATHTGSTTVESGTLLVSGSINGTTGVVVNEGALAGTGTIGALVIIGDGIGGLSTATLAPGTDGTIGTLTTGALSLANADARFKLEIDSTALLRDQLVVNGVLSLGTGVASIELLDLGFATLAGGESFVIATATSGVTGFFLNQPEGSSILAGTNSLTISYLNDQIRLTAVPEPGALASLLVGVGVLLGFGRVRRLGRLRVV